MPEAISEVLLVDLVLLVLVTITAWAVIQVRSLLSATILAGIYSLLMALVWTNMHALDVAFTEASVGAGISTILLLGAIVHTSRFCKREGNRVNLQALGIVGLTGAMLIYGTFDMPHFGDPEAPIHQYRVPKMLEQKVGKVPEAPAREHAPPDPHHPLPHDDFGGHVPNTVTSLLAAYRGFDTMFETTVIFVAGASLILLLRRREDEDELIESRPSTDKEASA